MRFFDVRTIKMIKNISADNKSWAILIFLSLVWGCSFILIKKAMVAFEPAQLACLRLTISAVAFTPFVLWHRKEIDWSKWMKFLAVGITGSGLPSFLFFIAQSQLSSSVAGLLNSLTPIWTLLIGIFIFRLNFERKKLLGVFIGFLGAASIVLLGSEDTIGGNPWFGIFVIIATICYGSSVNMVQAFFGQTKPIIISCVSFFLIGPPAMIYLALSDFSNTLMSNPQALQAFGAVAILSLFGTVLATILFYTLVQRTSAVFGSTVTYLMPAIAIFWGFIDGETISILHFAGMALILVGVYLTKK
ncbi:MAG: EamA family transporter [Saprospiraceae bacterium]|nr:EamA family transporter [Saprospiraceae bacterium]